AEAGEPASVVPADCRISDVHAAGVEAAAPPAADWLAEAAPTSEDAVEMAEAGEPASEAAFDWLSGEDEEPAAEPNAEIPDWLSEIGTASGREGEKTAAGAAASEASLD